MDMHGTLEYPVMGALGMDCLQYYCFQLDFSERKMRFLNADTSSNEILGMAFPITIQDNGLKAFIFADFLGQKDVPFVLDTGFANGGDLMLTSKLFGSGLLLPRNQLTRSDGHYRLVLPFALRRVHRSQYAALPTQT